MVNGDEVVPFEALVDADLIVDQLYDGGSSKTMADDPLARLLPVGNQGGFHYAGSPKQGSVRLGVLYTTAAEPDWPDILDPQTGVSPTTATTAAPAGSSTTPDAGATS